MALPINIKDQTGQPTFNKLAKSPSKGGVGINRSTLRRWWESREKLNDVSKKTKRYRVDKT